MVAKRSMRFIVKEKNAKKKEKQARKGGGMTKLLRWGEHFF